MMIMQKRSYTIPKNNARYNGKLKDILSISSRHKPEGKIAEPDLANIPLIRQSDNARLLLKYTTILAKSGDDGVSMDDLDQLQQDLEKLLSTSALRTRYLLGEIGEIDRNDGGHDRKAHDKTSLKRKRQDEKPKFKDLKNGIRVIKKHGLTVNKLIGDPHQDIPKVTLPKNDNSDKFWASIEPFCANVTKDDMAFLDNVIQEFSKEIDIQVPEVGDHYSNGWSEEIINDEQNLGKSPTKKGTATVDIKKNGLHAMVETFSTPQTQKLLAALLEERVLNSLPKNGENGKPCKLKSSEFTKLKSSSSSQKIGMCLDRRLKKELIEQGIITMEDLSKNMPEDEILAEIKKCQQELTTVNEYNIEELNKLKTIVMNDLHSNELKEELQKVDKQVLDLYNKIIVVRKTAQQEEGEEFDKLLFSEQITKDFESQADALLKRQIELNREINGLTDIQMLY